MTPRVEAWLRQANNDLAVDGGFHAQACYHARPTLLRFWPNHWLLPACPQSPWRVCDSMP